MMNGIHLLCASLFENSLSVIFVFCLLGIIKIYISCTKGRPNIPGPFPWPLIGNVISLGNKPQEAMKAMSKRYGPVYLMKLGGADVLVLNNYKVIKEALIKQRANFSDRPNFASFKNISQGKGIVFNGPSNMGETWKNMKGLAVKKLHKYVSMTDTRRDLSHSVCYEIGELVRIVTQECQDSSTNSTRPEPVINVTLANIICTMMFGHRYSHENEEFRDLMSLNREFGEVINSGSQIDVMPWVKVIPYFSKVLKTFDFLTKRLNTWMLNRTTEHRAGYKAGCVRDVIDTFIEESVTNPQGIMQDDTIMALTTDIFGAAQDTLSTATQWIFVYMMFFPEWQSKIQDEVDSVLQNQRLPNFDDRHKFPVTEATMHEIFRHTSMTPCTIPHSTSKNTVLGGYNIPKDLIVFINQFAANHDDKEWEEPSKFNPYRFLTEDDKLIPRAHEKYLFFSTGSRKCPGDELSRMLFVHIIATIVSLCEITMDPSDPITLDSVYNLSMRPNKLVTRMKVRNRYLLDQLTKSNSSKVKVYPNNYSKNNNNIHNNNNNYNNNTIFKTPAKVKYSKMSFSDDDEFIE